MLSFLNTRQGIKRFVRARLQRWLTKRIPKKKAHTLRHRNIFILPTKAGLGFIALFVLLWVLGTNYQNNLVLAVAFLLLAVMVVCIHHTYGNLAGLQISVMKTHPGFVGQMAQVDLLVKRDNHRHYDAVECLWPGADPVHTTLIKEPQARISVKVPITHRGWFQPPRLKVITTYPLGLLFAWSQLDFDAPILAYPQAIDTTIKPSQQLLDDSGELHHENWVAGHEEFAGLREYEPGDSLRRIDWRALARGQGLTTRLYEDYVSQYLWLDWQQFAGMSREARLSRLCASVLMAAKDSVEYGLRLPGLEISPSQGEQHQRNVLQALALFEWPLFERDVLKRETPV